MLRALIYFIFDNVRSSSKKF